MQIANVPIIKGPDKWLLAESLFHDDEMPGDDTPITFMVTREGREYRLRVSVTGIQKTRDEGVYEIIGMADVFSLGRERKKELAHIPVHISYSVKDRRGIANVQISERLRAVN